MAPAFRLRQVDTLREDIENWLRVVFLLDTAGKRFCYEILHDRENLPTDGGELYKKLESYQKKMFYQINEEVLCPSNKIINEDKFDILVYSTVIYYMFGDKYDKILDDLRDMRHEIFHMEDKSIRNMKFEQRWNDACDMLRNHGFAVESLMFFKKWSFCKVEEYKGIC